METTQERIVAAARQRFSENGFHGTTTAEIARTAGIAEGTIYRYFRDKKELFLACVEPAIRELVRRETAVVRTSSPREMLRNRMIERVRVIQEHLPVFTILFTEAPHHPEIASLLLEQVKTLIPKEELAMLAHAVGSGALKQAPNPLIMNIGLTAAIWAMVAVGPTANAFFADWPAPARYEQLESDLADFVCSALVADEEGPVTE
jgi:AcrR family transcriptional regulator